MSSSRSLTLPIAAAAGLLLAGGILLWSRDMGAPSSEAPRSEGSGAASVEPVEQAPEVLVSAELEVAERAPTAPRRTALTPLEADPGAEIETLLSELLGPRWPEIKAELGPVRLAALAEIDLSTLPDWKAVERDVYQAGQVWIEERRGTWPGGLSDRWRDVDRLDFARRAFNRNGVAIDAELDAHLRDLVREYNGKIDRLARNFWDEVSLAFDQEWKRPDYVVPLPDPAGSGRDQADLELWAVPGSTPGILLDVVAADQGWRVELPLVPEAAPAAARLLESIRELERQRLAEVRAAISGR